MSIARCKYCGRFNQKLNQSKVCLECEKQFHSVISKISKKYGVALK